MIIDNIAHIADQREYVEQAIVRIAENPSTLPLFFPRSMPEVQEQIAKIIKVETPANAVTKIITVLTQYQHISEKDSIR